MVALRLRRFDPDAAFARCPSPVVFIVGKRATGKTVLCRHLLQSLPQQPQPQQQPPKGALLDSTRRGAVLCRESGPRCCAETCRLEYASVFSPDRIHTGYDDRVVKDVIAEQKKLQAENTAAGLSTTASVVIEDVLYGDRAFHIYDDKIQPLRDIFYNGRAYRINLFVLMRYPPALPPALRANTDYVFLFREAIEGSRRRLHETFFIDDAMNYESFCAVLDACTKDAYDCLVLDYTAITHKTDAPLEDRLFFYKAPAGHEVTD